MILTTRKRVPQGPAAGPSITTSNDDIAVIKIKDLVIEVELEPDSALARAQALGGTGGRIVVRVQEAHNPMSRVTRVFTEFDSRGA